MPKSQHLSLGRGGQLDHRRGLRFVPLSHGAGALPWARHSWGCWRHSILLPVSKTCLSSLCLREKQYNKSKHRCQLGSVDPM